MKKITIAAALLFFAGTVVAQEEREGEGGVDTTRVNLKHVEVLIIERGGAKSSDSIVINPKDRRNNEAHWAGLDFGFNVLMNNAFQQSFPGEDFLQNDIARSQVWNLNILEHKFRVVHEYVGITTGLGFSFRQVGFDNNYVLRNQNDSTMATMDTLINYGKNKLRAAYITVPLLLEFNTHKNNEKGFYLATGVVGGLRIGSTYKRVYSVNGNKVKDKQKGDYNLNPFMLDLTARMGYGSFGAFVTYSLTPLFERGATINEAYPLTAGLTLNF